MLYSILIYVDENTVDAMSKEVEDAHIAQHLALQEKLAARGKMGPAVRLEGTRMAKQLHTADEATIVDGPFAETKEQLLGFYMVDCESEDEALEIARALPSIGTIFEVRPVRLYFPDRRAQRPESQ